MKKDDLENSNSKIRIWAKKEEEKSKDQNTKQSMHEALFGALIYGLTNFCETLPEEQKIDQNTELMGKIRRKHNNDASFFELGCYLFFRIDLWCFKNHHEEWRNRRLSILINQFISLFEEALDTEKLVLVFNNRLDLYGKAIRGKLTRVSLPGRNQNQTRSDNDKIQDAIYFYLTQLILKTGNNTLPKIYKFNKEGDSLIVPISLDAFEIFLIFNGILAWEKYILPVSIKAIENSIIIDERSNEKRS